MKLVLSVGLLLSFFVLLTPRDLWHECEHHDFGIEHSPNEQSIEQDDCFACDFELGIIAQSSVLQFTFVKQVYINLVYTVFSFFTKDKFQQFSHRGPPIS